MSKIVDVHDETFDQFVAANPLVLVEFGANWCEPCKSLEPILHQLSGEVQGRAVIGQVDVDRSPVVARRYGILSMPTMLVFRNGQPAEPRLIGLKPKIKILEALGL